MIWRYTNDTRHYEVQFDLPVSIRAKTLSAIYRVLLKQCANLCSTMQRYSTQKGVNQNKISNQ